MTKVVKLIAENKAVKSDTPKMEFITLVSCSGEIEPATVSPSDYDNVSILCLRGDGDNYDIILAWDDDMEEDERAIYLGKWNGGII